MELPHDCTGTVYDERVNPSARRTRRTALVIVWVLTVLGLVSAPVVPARAEDLASLAWSLTGVTLSGTDANAQVSLTATVRNTGSQPLYGLTITMFRHQTSLRSSQGLRELLKTEDRGTSLPATGSAVYQASTDDAPLHVGASTSVQVTATLGELGFTRIGRAYVVGMQGTASVTADGPSWYVGSTRTAVSLRTDASPATPIARVIHLTATPSMLACGNFANDNLAAELSGRLAQLLDAATQTNSSYVIDPALYAEVSAMADGYSVLSGDTPQPGAGQQVAAAWLAKFDDLPKANGYRTLYAEPDLNPAVLAEHPDIVSRALVATTAVAELATLPLLVIPHDGNYTDKLPGPLETVAPRAWLASTVNEETPVIARNGDLIVRTSAAADLGLDPVTRTQYRLAEATMGGATARIALITDPDELAVYSQSWMTWTTLGSLLDKPVRSDNTTGSFLYQNKWTSHLPESLMDGLPSLEASLHQLADVVSDPEAPSAIGAILTSTVSGAWIDADESGYLTALSRQTADIVANRRIRIATSPRFVMSSRVNEFPVSITNNMDCPVRVHAVFESSNAQRLTIPDSESVSVSPGDTVTVNVRPQASSTGLVSVTAHLESMSGQRVSEDVTIDVESTELGIVGLLIIFISGAVLVASTALRIHQVRRRTKDDA